MYILHQYKPAEVQLICIFWIQLVNSWCLNLINIGTGEPVTSKIATYMKTDVAVMAAAEYLLMH